ncbi:hypothetical protein [Enterococcus sp. CSURQ0835]|uniref:hypothetical protein n=1 Tax=Enterococcus sp. CSURQ0835 TaxID=2681394 RepID=UPI00135BE62B|nr:hypothetical protein [Enterococcus sp. CSURQ0835]
MDQKKWQLVQQHFGEIEYLDDGYYRLKNVGERFKLAFLTSGACGEKVIQPEITIEWVGGRAVPIALLDLAATPIKRWDRSETEKLESAAEVLLTKFCLAKRLTAAGK